MFFLKKIAESGLHHGSPLAVPYASLYRKVMWITSIVINHLELKYWARYIGDRFMIWNSENLKQLYDLLNLKYIFAME